LNLPDGLGKRWDARLNLGDTNILQFSNKKDLCKLWKTTGSRRLARCAMIEVIKYTPPGWVRFNDVYQDIEAILLTNPGYTVK
jgi:hypothetical protein